MIVEKASGKTYEQFVEEEIFAQAGHDPQPLRPSRGDHPPAAPPATSKDDKEFRNTDFISMTQPYAAGALMSTVDDLAIWGRALQSETLFKKASLDRMLTAAI